MPGEYFYRGAKILGLVSFIPFILAAGPLAGYFTGVFLQEKFHLPLWAVLVSVGVGFLAAITEVIKILRVIGRVNK